MREVAKTSAFKRCVKLLNRRHWDLAPLAGTIGKLQRDVPSSKLFKDHPLAGPFADKRTPTYSVNDLTTDFTDCTDG